MSLVCDVRSWRLAVMLGVLLLAAPAFSVGPAAQSTLPVPSGSAAPADATAPAPDSLPPYVLHRGDEITIRVQNLPQLNDTIQIRPDGRISMALLDDVPAAGRTPAELGEALGQALGKYYREPHVSVIVKSFAAQSVYVGGEVQHPGLISLRAPTTALQAVIEAGGLKNTSLDSSVTILRPGPDGATRTIVLDVQDVLANRERDVQLQASDVVYVPKSEISVYVGGEVGHPGLLPVSGHLTAMAAVIEAGGFTDEAKSNTVVLIRKSDTNKPMVRTLKLDQVVRGNPDTVLKPFDVLYVPRSKIANVNRFVDQYIRRMIPITLTAGFTYLLGGTAVVP